MLLNFIGMFVIDARCWDWAKTGCFTASLYYISHRFYSLLVVSNYSFRWKTYWHLCKINCVRNYG